MQRTLSTLAAALVLTLSVAMVAQAQESYPQGTTAQQPVDQSQPTTPDQTTPPVDQSTTTTTTSSELPRTASPLPLVGLSGLMSLAAGAWLARSRRNG